jgi:hypothetical protein
LVNGCSSFLVSHFFANLSDKFIPPLLTGCGESSYTLLTCWRYAGISVGIYAVEKRVFGFNC